MALVYARGAACAAIATAICATSVSASVLRDDIVGPPWERFQPFTTFQEWEFFDPGDIAPDGELAPFNPNTHFPLVAKPGPDVIWSASLPGTNLSGIYTGTGDDGSYIDFCIPNWIDMEPLKLLWIQINGVWDEAAPPIVSGILGVKDGVDTFGAFLDSDETFPGFHRVESWEILPNPDWETIRIFLPEGAIVNQVVIDTISFPTPGAASAFGLAGLALARRRR